MDRMLSKLVCYQMQIAKYSTAIKSKVKSFKDIPGPLSIPYYGTSWKFFPLIGEFDHMHLDKAAQQLYKKYGPIVRQKAGNFNLVHLYDPNDFETVYKHVTPPENQIRLSFFTLNSFRASKPNIYKSPGILPGNGEAWWKIRKTSQKPLSPIKEARSFLKHNDDIVQDFVVKLGNMGSVDDFILLANRVNMELTLMMLFDKRWHCFDKVGLLPDSTQSKIMSIVLDYTETLGYYDRSLLNWTHPSSNEFKQIYEKMDLMEEFVIDQIEKVKNGKNFDNNPGIVAQLLKEPEVAEQELLGAIIDIVYAGVDTTALTTSFLMYELSRNKRVQDLVISEAVKLLPKGKESPITSDVINNATYLKAVLKEILRLHPIISVQNRKLSSTLELSGYSVPKGTVVFLENYAACLMERNFEKPLEFIPERWLKGSEKIHPYIVLPFGFGVRTCIARRRAEQILIVLMLRIFREYEVRYHGEELGCITPFLVKPDRPINLSFSNHNR